MEPKEKELYIWIRLLIEAMGYIQYSYGPENNTMYKDPKGDMIMEYEIVEFLNDIK